MMVSKMSEFTELRDIVRQRIRSLSVNPTFRVDVTRHELWDAYLGSFKPEDNPIYRERRVHDCQCCKQFIRDIGAMIFSVDGEYISIWDFDVEGMFKPVVEAMRALVNSKPIKDVFLHYQEQVGMKENYQEFEEADGGGVKIWEHFYASLPSSLVNTATLGTALGNHQADKDVLLSSLQLISMDAIDTVLDLIDSKIHRGEEYRNQVADFKTVKGVYEVLVGKSSEDFYVWSASVQLGRRGRIKNTAIGTLLTDLSEGVELTVAVAKYEDKVSAGNFKRTTALVTPAMIKKTQARVAELGYASATVRRYATQDDITINNIIYADRSIKHLSDDPFDALLADTKPTNLNEDQAIEVSMEAFIDGVVPHAEKIEARVSNAHANNFVSLIAPQYADAKNMLKWGNNFTWSYKGEFTESIKERVKAAGGKVDGILRASLSWFNGDDLDIHCKQSDGNPISYQVMKCGRTGAHLDVDMNASGANNRTDPVENITWSKTPTGDKLIQVHNYSRRDSNNPGFEVEIEYQGKLHNFVYDRPVKPGEKIDVAMLGFVNGEMAVTPLIPSTISSKQVWGVSTEKFHDVSVICNSPNHWNDNQTGNRHWFFMLKDCTNPDESRGIYTEFLSSELHEHRKVFEMLGAKMRVPKSDKQLSGLGFSSTLPNTLFCRVTKDGSQRLYKINVT